MYLEEAREYGGKNRKKQRKEERQREAIFLTP
jgi:hypothetical protein